VGSSVASWLPACTVGSAKRPPVKLALMTPLKFMKVGSAAAAMGGNTLLRGATVTVFTVSLPKPMSTAPTMRDPVSSVSVSAAFDSLIAVPLAPAVEMMALELVMVAAPPA